MTLNLSASLDTGLAVEALRQVSNTLCMHAPTCSDGSSSSRLMQHTPGIPSKPLTRTRPHHPTAGPSLHGLPPFRSLAGFSRTGAV
ncbi:hypothetical protein HYQ46_009705 [Verticillium longisporum]|nr:hypothetical protein HYQ46_009705 [Verticillium longisporum]